MNIAARRTLLGCIIASVVCLAANQSLTAQTSRSFIEFLSGGEAKAESGAGGAASTARLEQLCPISDRSVANRIIFQFGSAFSASDQVQRPSTCLFEDSAAVKAFQGKLRTSSGSVDGVAILLQEPAMSSLLKVVAECEQQGIKVRPFDGAIAAARSYEDTARLWNSRFLKALDYWSKSGRIPEADAIAARNEATVLQLKRVVEWENQGFWFGTSLTGSIFSSVAAPGTSQHLFLLAFDVAPPVPPRSLPIFNSNGWFRTVTGDPTHFTYLGVPEPELPSRGLQKIRFRGVDYWVPALPESAATSRSN